MEVGKKLSIFLYMKSCREKYNSMCHNLRAKVGIDRAAAWSHYKYVQQCHAFLLQRGSMPA